MKLLIAPRSPVPMQIKAFIRWAIVAYNIKLRNRRYVLHEYSAGSDVPVWSGWLEHSGIDICYVDNDGGLHYKW